MKGHYNNILVPTDFSDQAHLALEQAYTLANLLNVEITLLHVMSEYVPGFVFGLFSREPSEIKKADYEESCNSHLLQIAESASKNSLIKVNPLLMSGKPIDKIGQLASDIYAQYIVMATNSSNNEEKNTYVGETTSGIIFNAPCPVLTFNGANIRKKFDTIILPLDFTKETQQKVNKAIEIAKYYNSTIRVFSVLLTDDKEIVAHLNGQLMEVKNYIERRDVYTVATIIQGDRFVGDLASHILRYAYETDGDMIMIMKQQELSTREKFLGSNTTGLIGKSKIPVLSIVPK